MSVVPARPLSAWGPSGRSQSRQSQIVNASRQSRMMQRESMIVSPTPNRTSHFLVPPGGRAREGSPHSLESKTALLSSTSRVDNQQYEIQEVGRKRPVSILANPTAGWNLPSPEPESPPQDLQYPAPARSPSERRSQGSKGNWKFSSRSPSPTSPTGREEEELFNLYPEGQRVSSNGIEPVELLADYPKGRYSFDYSPYQPARGSIQHPAMLGRPLSTHSDEEVIAPVARYEQKRISFIPVLEAGGGDLSSKRYSFLEDEAGEERRGGGPRF